MESTSQKRKKVIYKFYVLLFLIFFNCTNCVEDKIENRECTRKFRLESNFDEIKPNIKIQNFDSLSVVQEFYKIDKRLHFVNFAVYRLTSNGEINGIVENKLSNLEEYRSYFIFDKDTCFINQLIQDEEIPSYNFLITHIEYDIEDKNKIYAIEFSQDCEACFETTMYRVLVNGSSNSSFQFCKEYLYPND